jgi:hypothetical protein
VGVGDLATRAPRKGGGCLQISERNDKFVFLLLLNTANKGGASPIEKTASRGRGRGFKKTCPKIPSPSRKPRRHYISALGRDENAQIFSCGCGSKFATELRDRSAISGSGERAGQKLGGLRLTWFELVELGCSMAAASSGGLPISKSRRGMVAGATPGAAERGITEDLRLGAWEQCGLCAADPGAGRSLQPFPRPSEIDVG